MASMTNIVSMVRTVVRLSARLVKVDSRPCRPFAWAPQRVVDRGVPFSSSIASSHACNMLFRRQLATAKVQVEMSKEDDRQFDPKKWFENNFFRNLLKSKHTPSAPDQMNSTFQEIVDMHSNPQLLEDHKYSAAVTKAETLMSRSTEEELINFLSTLAQSEFGRKFTTQDDNFRTFRSLWGSVDYELTAKLREKRAFEGEDLNRYLDIFLTFYDIGVCRMTNYCHLLERICFHSLKKFDNEGFLKFVFMINALRKPLTIENHEKLEAQLVARLPFFSVDEVGLVSAALFKTKTRIRNIEITKEILKKVQDKITSVEEVALSSIFKILRFSKHYSDSGPQVVRDFINACTDSRSELNLLTLVHLCRLASYYVHGSNELLETSLEKIFDDPSSVRIKDIERIMRTCADFEYDIPTRTLERLLDLLRQKTDQCLLYPNVFTSLLNIYSAYDIFPEDLIKFAFSKEFFEKLAEKDYEIERYYGAVFLYTTVSLKARHLLPHLQWPQKYIEHAIGEVKRLTLSEIMSKKRPSKTSFEQIFRKLYLGTRQVYGNQVGVLHLLPFSYHPDIVVYPEKLEQAPVNLKFQLTPNSAENLTVIVLQCVTLYGDNNGSEKLNKLAIHKVNLLKEMGYNVVLVPWYDIVDFDVLRIGRKMSLLLDVPIRK